MDRLIYTAMTGAKHILEQQATTAHNLANATTTGFKAQVDSFRAVPILGDGMPTRAFVVDATVGTDYRSGALQQTGRDLDIAVRGEGWIAVQRIDGSEGYTRNGDLKINENGQLQTATGLNVMGEGGPISIPPDATITIAKDGTVSTVSRLATPSQTTTSAVTTSPMRPVKLIAKTSGSQRGEPAGLAILVGGGCGCRSFPAVTMRSG